MSQGWVFLIVVGGVLYFVGYCWCFGKIWASIEKDHLMAHSTNYIMTDMFMPSFVFGIAWPLMAVGVVIREAVKLIWPNSRVSRADAAEMMLGVFIGSMLCALLWSVIESAIL